ncbi:hypothetical protein IT418_03465 [bacterium]|nr:hypothetical protein [bacterium]
MNNTQRFYFIGGAPLTGKSTLAERLNGYLKIGTDDIKIYLQKVLKQEEYPELFYDYELDAIAFYEKYKDAETVFRLEREQADTCQNGVSAYLATDFGFGNMVFEGIAITPKYVSQLLSRGDLHMNYIFLHDSNEQRVRERIFARGLYDDSDKYPDWIKEIEVKWVVMYNYFYKTECEKYGLKLYEVEDSNLIALE